MAINRIACIHITHDDVRLIEGRTGEGVLLITHTAIVEKASRFYSGDRLAYMTEMVNSIVNSMEVNSFQAKDLYIVYDNKVQVDFFLDEHLHTETKVPKFEFNKKSNVDSFASKKGNTGTIVHKSKWGKYITEVDQGELTTTTRMERDFVDFMISEFQYHGYKVKSIESPDTALLYLRNIVTYSYDALNKLIVYANNREDGQFYQFTKDAPTGKKAFHFEAVQSNDFIIQTVGCIQDEIRKSNLHNPYIILTGDAYADHDIYQATCEALKEEGLCCLDIYSLWHDRSAPINAVKIIVPDDGEDLERDGRFGVCVALMCRGMERKPENMIEGLHINFFGKDEKKRIVDLLFTLSLLMMIYGVITFGISAAEKIIAGKEYKRVSSTAASQLSVVENQRDAEKAKLKALSTIDNRYAEIFRFVYAQVNNSENINIASIDTEDVIPVSSTSTVSEDESDASETEEAGLGIDNYVMQTIIIRGYSRTSDGPVELYKSLVASEIGQIELIGVEQVDLPTNENLFAFEMTIQANN